MRVLYAVHALPAAGLGGTELYTRRLAETVAADHAVAVATGRGHETAVEGVRTYALPDPADWTDPTGVNSGLGSGVVHEAVDRRFGDVLDAFEPDVVHFQHFKFLSATLPDRCADRGIPSLATLHDFWTLCHREQLVRPPGERCAGPESVAKCADCYADALAEHDADNGGELQGTVEGDGESRRDAGSEGDGDSRRTVEGDGNPRNAVAARRDRLAATRAAVDLLVAPSEFLRDRFVAYGTPPERIVHRRNGVRVGEFADAGFDPDGPLRVGYAGRVTRRKGVHVLLDAFGRVEGDAELHVFGELSPDDPYHDRLREAAGDRVTFHGRYDDAATPYRTMDVLVLPSLWYENSPLVVQEAFASGVPVVAGDVGGMAELVTHGEDGLTFAVGDQAALARTLQRLVDEPGTVRDLRRGVEPPTSLAEHARELTALYERCRGGRVEDGVA